MRLKKPWSPFIEGVDMKLEKTRNPFINGGKYGKLIFTSIYEITDPNHPNARKSVPELLNRKNQSNIATLREVRPFFVDDEIYHDEEIYFGDIKLKEINCNMLAAASPIITRTVGGFESKLPIVDLPTEGGKVYFRGEFQGETIFIVGTKDVLLKAARIALAQAGLDRKQIKQ